MTTTTALSITHAARVGADLIDYWNGLPTPGSVRASVAWSHKRGKHEAVDFMFYNDRERDSFADLREWAIGLHAETPGKGSWGIGADASDFVTTEDGRDYLDAEFEHEGVVIRLASNRPHSEDAGPAGRH